MVTELRQSSPDNITIVGGTRVNFFIPDSPNRISYYRGGLGGNDLIREHPLGANNVLMDDIDSLIFCCWHDGVCDADCSASHLLEIRIQGTKTMRGEAVTLPIREQVRLRNE